MAVPENIIKKIRLVSILSRWKDEDRLKKWLVSMRRIDFKPTTHSRICGDHFLPVDYYYPGSRELRKNTVLGV